LEDALARWLPDRPAVLLVLGSGLAALAEELEDRAELPFHSVPGLPVPGVEGHEGRFVAGRMEGRRILAQVGRLHRYEGHASSLVGLPVRLAFGTGVRAAILTNAAGSLGPRHAPGSLAVLRDFLRIPPGEGVGGSAPTLAGRGRSMAPGRIPPAAVRAAFSPSLTALALRAAEELGIPLASAVYAGVKGPSYETPAEVRMLRTLGADLVGMSTVEEVRTASGVGLPVLGVSAVTNFASGVGGGRLSHGDVLERGARAASNLTRLIRGVIRRLPDARSD
jgi:purine-nucleoside phosphorylase